MRPSSLFSSLPRLLPAIALCLVTTTSLHAAAGSQGLTAQNRISNGAGASLAAVPQTVSPRVQKAADLGDADPSRALQALSLHFSLTTTQQAALVQLLSDQQNPKSARYHQWLTPEQFAAQFGLSNADQAVVSSWLTSQGFKITEVSRSGTFIRFSGTVAQASEAFHTSIHSFNLKGEQHFANISDPSLPAGVASVVSDVTGLNDFRPKARMHGRTVPLSAVHPNNTVSTTEGTEHFIAPGDLYTIYDLNPLISSSNTGTGISIAVMGQVDLTTADVAAFRTASALPAKAPTIKIYGTDPGAAGATQNGPTSDDLDESLLDVEWAGATAPAANIIFVESEDVLGISLLDAIDNDLAPIMTVSYGDCESGYTTSDRNTFNAAFQQANAEGITITGPTGDSGATDCDYDVTSATNGLTVDFPASSPYVTAVGGTMFNEGTGTYWSATNGAYAGSATGYIPEAVWNETSEDNTGTNGGFGAGGGGASLYFTKPAWQVGTGVPTADYSRDVPDVSLNAAANHDGYYVCAQGSCASGTYFNDGTADIFGGTSVSTPSFAGILALVEQKTGSRLGNVNPTLYALANSTYYTSVFHDVTTGNNDSPCTAGTTDCPSGGDIGFTAGIGYDQATGWGSVDAYNLVSDWSLVSAIGVGSAVGQSISTTSVIATPSSTTAGTAVALAITVATGTSAVSTTPTGTVQILVDGTASGSAVTLASGAATYSLDTTSITSGSHTITAAYTGDTTYAGSKGTTTVDITSATAADFTLTPATATTTIATGGTAPAITFTATGVNGFAGSIAFTASAATSLDATYDFSVSPITLSTTTTTGTTAFTLYAYVSDLRHGSAKRLTLTNVPKVVASAHPHSQSRNPWYAAGSGSALACILLFTLPRRRRFGALFALAVSLAVLGAAGCGSSSVSNSTGSTTGTTNTAAGTYTVTVTATGTTTTGATLTHNSTVTFIVQ